MAVYENQKPLGSVPTQESHLYPDADGKPMAASDKHRLALTQLLSRLGEFFRQTPEVYVSGDLLMYYLQGDMFPNLVGAVCIGNLICSPNPVGAVWNRTIGVNLREISVLFI